MGKKVNNENEKFSLIEKDFHYQGNYLHLSPFDNKKVTGIIC